ncbi:MAG: BolA family protein [Myxococcota bacterium]
MSMSIVDPTQDTCAAIRTAITAALPDAEIKVSGNGGHFAIEVVSAAFAQKNTLAKQRLVYAAITPLMSGPNAPVHAVDSLQTRTPEE